MRGGFKEEKRGSRSPEGVFSTKMMAEFSNTRFRTNAPRPIMRPLTLTATQMTAAAQEKLEVDVQTS